jgi:guanosine-3',5'-bis(diphosphate) 3'-pyrophosphohydrolase
MGLAPSAAAFFARVSPSFSADDSALLHAAWNLAQLAHRGQLRQSGEPYVTHPLAVAELVFDLIEPDAYALCAALLHDVVEDSQTSLSTIENQFGLRVANIVDGVSKLDRVGDASVHAAKEETLRKLVAAGGRDWRVFAVKLCDRLHNMRTLNAVSMEKRRRVARETYSVFFPLARYVGFHRVATELESWSLRSLYPMRWSIVDNWCRYKSAVDARRLRGVFEFAGPCVVSAGSA